MPDTLAEQLDALIAQHRLSMAQDMDLIQHLDAELLAADTHIIRQLERIVEAHENRREDAIALLRELHSRMMRGPSIPPIEDRQVSPEHIGAAVKAKLTASQMFEQMRGEVH